MSDGDGTPVSRRQFFRGVTGDFLRVLGELSGLEKDVDEPRVLYPHLGDVIVPPERQESALQEVVAFLEQLKAPDEELAEEPTVGSPPAEEPPPPIDGPAPE